MALYCPFCSDEITPETTKCPSCDHIYDSDTLTFINLSQKAQDENPHERRKQNRFPVKLKVAFSTPKEFMGHYIFNLSPGGLFVESSSALNPGEKLGLKIFFLDKTEPMEIPCEVMWCRTAEELTPDGKLPAGMGLKFLNLSPENLERLIDVLNRSLM